MRSVSDKIIETMTEAGIDHVFTIPGGGMGRIFSALYDHRDKIKVILTRNEQTASCMAEMYGRLTGQMRRYWRRSLVLRGDLRRSVSEHRAILRAARRGDADKAAVLMADHIRVPQQQLQSMTAEELVEAEASFGHAQCQIATKDGVQPIISGALEKLRRQIGRVKDGLGAAFAVADINENQSAEVAAGMDPAGQGDWLPDVRRAQFVAMMRALLLIRWEGWRAADANFRDGNMPSLPVK
jgi:hypothetical protein